MICVCQSHHVKEHYDILVLLISTNLLYVCSIFYILPINGTHGQIGSNSWQFCQARNVRCLCLVWWFPHGPPFLYLYHPKYAYTNMSSLCKYGRNVNFGKCQKCWNLGRARFGQIQLYEAWNYEGGRRREGITFIEHESCVSSSSSTEFWSKIRSTLGTSRMINYGSSCAIGFENDQVSWTRGHKYAV